MFKRRLIEVSALFLYWYVCIHWVYIRINLNTDIDKAPFETAREHAKILLSFLAGYVVFHHLVMFLYMKWKMMDIKMWNDLKKFKENPKERLEQQEQKRLEKLSHMHSLDTVDGEFPEMQPSTPPQMIRTISQPLLTESDLAYLQVRHETRPLPQPHCMLSLDEHTIIMNPDLLMDFKQKKAHL